MVLIDPLLVTVTLLALTVTALVPLLPVRSRNPPEMIKPVSPSTFKVWAAVTVSPLLMVKDAAQTSGVVAKILPAINVL